MRKLLWPLALVPLLGCQAAGGFFQRSGRQGSTEVGPGSLFDTPGNPVAVEVVLDTARAAEALVPAEGGSLRATGADGTEYTLEIPADALMNETLITMTPVETVAGMPFGGPATFAVHLEPDGLSLLNFAVLTVTPAQDLPVDEQILFAYRSAGENLTLAIPVVDSDAIQIQVLHFSGYGVTHGNLAEVAPVRGSLGGDAGSRVESAVGEAAQAERRGTSFDYGRAESLLRDYFEQGREARRQATGENCAAGQRALAGLLGATRQAQLLGSAVADEMWDEAVSLMAAVVEKCMEEEYERCEADHIVHRILPMYLGFQRQIQLGLSGAPGLAEVDQKIRKYVEQCLSFELVFESTVVSGAPDNGFESRVKAEVPLRFNVDRMEYVGSAPLVNEDFEFRIPDCTATSERGGGTFDFAQIAFLADPPTAIEPAGPVRDLNVNYFPGETSETFSYRCDETSFGPMTSSLWTGMFIAVHETDASSDGGFRATGWRSWVGSTTPRRNGRWTTPTWKSSRSDLSSSTTARADRLPARPIRAQKKVVSGEWSVVCCQQVVARLSASKPWPSPSRMKGIASSASFDCAQDASLHSPIRLTTAHSPLATGKALPSAGGEDHLQEVGTLGGSHRARLGPVLEHGRQ